MNRSALAAAVLCLVGVFGVTLSPARYRPHVAPPQLERAGAWALVAALGVAALPRRAASITVGIALIAVGSEAAQLFAPGRHARLTDAGAKDFGALVGGAAALLMSTGGRSRHRR